MPVKRKARPDHMLRKGLQDLREHPIPENNRLMGRIFATFPPVTNTVVTAAVAAPVGVGRDVVHVVDLISAMDGARLAGVHRCGR